MKGTSSVELAGGVDVAAKVVVAVDAMACARSTSSTDAAVGWSSAATRHARNISVTFAFETRPPWTSIVANPLVHERLLVFGRQ